MDHCDNCGGKIEMDEEGGEFTHSGGRYGIYCNENSFYTNGVAVPFVPSKYTVLMHDGMSPGSDVPPFPQKRNQAGTLREAMWMFREWLRDSGNDYLKADGYEQPSAEVILTKNWDGISYGDYPWTCMLERGIRGGILVKDV